MRANVHPAADAFPMMNAEQYEGLKSDIAERGQQEVIVYWRGQLIDGRNRLKACRELEIEPTECELDEGADPVAYIISANLHRRHLTTSQRSMIAARMAKLERGEVGNGRKVEVQNCTLIDDAANLLNVSTRSVKTAKSVINDGCTELIDAVDAGDIPVSLAADLARDTPKAEQKPIVEAGKKAVKVHVANNSGNNEWYTPPKYIVAARNVMGSIDLDPASSEIANRTVNATECFTADDDGLSCEWYGNVWMNPPYAYPLIQKFCAKLCDSVASGAVSQAVVLVNNATETKWFHELPGASSALCFCRGRVKFLAPDGNPSGSPLQGQAILYFGSNFVEFVDEFSSYGSCLAPAVSQQCKPHGCWCEDGQSCSCGRAV